jgi:dynein heavy chain
MTPDRGGQLTTCPRLTRHFNVLSIESFSNDLMRTIFQPIINAHFARAGLAEHYDPGAFMLIDASVKIYNQVVSRFLPTPAKLYYLFDFRDFTRLIQGVLVFSSAGLSRRASKETNFYTIIRLWVHEACRVFADRFNDPADTAEFYERVKEVVESEFKVNFENLFRRKAEDSGEEAKKNRNVNK